ncbi:MAG TPA: ATP-binding protein [Pseudonocardia sp.]|jgi:serine/threonine-protein kinase RsbW|nr:ATP-binding protein [Pseudonocardia sp.]
MDHEGQSAPGRVEFVHRSWPADPEQLAVIRRELAGWLAPLNLSEDQTGDVILAVDEATANAVRHAYGDGGGNVELTLWTERDTLCIEVVDHGSWQPPDEHPTDGGRGIELMHHMSESVLIRIGGRGSRVLLRHRVPRGGGWDAARDG